MSLLDQIFESFLIEDAALTKGSQRVMNDKKLVASLADSVRDDAQSNPSAFPPGSKRNFQNATDEAVAHWFLENIDRIEREGYEGVIYSRDGVNSEWIVRRYIAGSHSWEDLTGVMNMNLNDWYQLKNRNMLDANHKDLPKFNSVRDVGYYMTTHYKNQLEKVRDAAKNAARNKMAKSVKLVDNDQYRIYTTLNRAAGCALGLGTQWCTANSNYGGHFHSYSDRAMLFQLFPYSADTDEEGKKILNDNEKYQFDAGGPNFMDVTDRPVRPEVIREKFPYIFSDLSHALRTNKSKLEKAFQELSADPTLQADDFKIKKYEIDEEINKLHKFVDRGYMTDEARPPKVSASDTATGEQPEVVPQDQPPQEPQMESIRDLARSMLEDVTLGHIVQSFRPHNQDGEESPMTHGEDNLDEEVDECGDAKARLARALGGQSGMVDEDDAMMQDAGGDVGAQAATGGGGSMGSMGGVGGSHYAPGTAPTVPESIQIKESKMKNVDKDVAAMMASLKRYDKLNESVLGMTTVGMARPQINEISGATAASAANKRYQQSMSHTTGERDFGSVNKQTDANTASARKRGATDNDFSSSLNQVGSDERSAKSHGYSSPTAPSAATKRKHGLAEEDFFHNPNVPANKQLKAPPEEVNIEEEQLPEPPKEIKIGKSLQKQGYGKQPVKEAAPDADADVLAWMDRFSKLGNMKGYGR